MSNENTQKNPKGWALGGWAPEPLVHAPRRYFLALRADPDAVDEKGKTPLVWAREKDRLDVVRLLGGWAPEPLVSQLTGLIVHLDAKRPEGIR